jgi:hypothetical protein
MDFILMTPAVETAVEFFMSAEIIRPAANVAEAD